MPIDIGTAPDGPFGVFKARQSGVAFFVDRAEADRWCAETDDRTADQADWGMKPIIQWIGLRENLQENPIFHGKITLVSCRFSPTNQSIESWGWGMGMGINLTSFYDLVAKKGGMELWLYPHSVEKMGSAGATY